MESIDAVPLPLASATTAGPIAFGASVTDVLLTVVATLPVLLDACIARPWVFAPDWIVEFWICNNALPPRPVAEMDCPSPGQPGRIRDGHAIADE
jgi:hypothetical protein